MIRRILSKLFGFVVNKRNEKYENEESITRCKIPVISIGNLSVGGTGKTPFVQMITKYFIKRGHKVGIIGRGYKRNSKGEVIISDGENLLVDAETGGDEMVLLGDTLKVPVIAHDEKWKAALSMQEKFNPDVIIVDDGFQHRKLYRDLDIVIVDRDTIDNPELMPKGRLREPVDSLSRADVVCFAGGFDIPEQFSKHINPSAKIIRVKPIHANPYTFESRSSIRFPEIKEVQKGVIPFAGIAKPKRFFDMLNSMGYKTINPVEFDDHHKYSLKDLENILDVCKKNNISNIATTEKDAAKLNLYIKYFRDNNLNCYIFPIALTITDGKDDFLKMLNKMFPRKTMG